MGIYVCVTGGRACEVKGCRWVLEGPGEYIGVREYSLSIFLFLSVPTIGPSLS